MNAAPLTIPAVDAKSGAKITVQVDQTDVDAVTLHEISDAGSDTSYGISGIRKVAEGVFEGTTHVLGQNPTIRLSVEPASLNVTLSHAWFMPGPFTYLESAAMLDTITAWIDSAGFPAA